MMLKTLSMIGKVLNEDNIQWALGASLLLNRYGLENEPQDIDLFVELKSSQKVNDLLATLGKRIDVAKSSLYATKTFYRYDVKGVGIDVMGGFQIRHPRGVYRYHFDEYSIVEKQWIHGVEIPLTALEDWYILYQLLPNREAKVERIEDYFQTEGIQHPNLLKRALRGNLPLEVRNKSYTLLKSNI